ncbi:CDP-alcohol phosphatidyltransferase family protein [bacterium]|nr:CDP-alcohol phosphatidyltransferase family protein [bacterium]
MIKMSIKRAERGGSRVSTASLDCKKLWTVANVLTLARLAAAPYVVASIAYERWGLAFGFFVFAAVTDFLDGFCARLMNDESKIGALLDPIADKVFIATSFAALTFTSPSFLVPGWFACLIFARETILLCGSALTLRFSPGSPMTPSIFGKLTTFFQMAFISWLFICRFMVWAPAKTYYALLAALAVFAVFSCIHYLVRGVLALCPE